MSAPVVSALPQAPQRTDLPSVFSSLADAFVAALQPFRNEINALAEWMNTTAGQIQINANTASTAATTATNAANTATAKAGIATTAANEASALTERYQLALSSDPTLNKTGGALVAGDWYINTTTGFIRAYNGSGWVNGLVALIGVESLNGKTGVLTGFTENAAAQTLTNKTLTTPTLSGTASGTTMGRLGFSSGDVTYGTGTQQRTVVNTDAAQTLTNKTLTTPTLSGTASGTTAGRIGYSGGVITYGTGSAQRVLVNTDAAQTISNKDIRTTRVEITNPTTAVSGTTYVFLSSTTLTLPLNPTVGTTVGFVNKSNTETPVINRNGQRIMNLEENVVLNDLNAFGTFMYSGTTNGWILV